MRVKDEEISNEEVRRRFSTIEKMEDVWRTRQLLLIGHIVRIEDKKFC